MQVSLDVWRTREPPAGGIGHQAAVNVNVNQSGRTHWTRWRRKGYHRTLTVIDNLTRHRCQGGEFVRGSLRVLPRQMAHERTLAH